MQRIEAIEKGIKDGDINGLREAVGSICYVRRDFSSGEFDEIIRYIESQGIKLKDHELKGKLISSSKNGYTDEDFARAVFELKKNFCDERIEDVKKIGKSLYQKQKQAVQTGPVTMASKSQQKTQASTDPNAEGHQKPKNTIWRVLLAVMAILLIVLVFMGVKYLLIHLKK